MSFQTTNAVQIHPSSKSGFFIANGSYLPRAKIEDEDEDEFEDEFEDDNKRELARGKEMLGRIVAMLIRLVAKLPTLIPIDFLVDKGQAAGFLLTKLFANKV